MDLTRSVSILGCGESGAKWGGTGDSIGVNDCWKFGRPTDYLMVIDPPGRFTADRRKTISDSKPKHFVTDSKAWLQQFHSNKREAETIKPNSAYKEIYCTNGPKLIKYRFSPWRGRIMPDQIQYWHTSPFPAISLAYLLGYKEIILWGVDFNTHKSWNPTKKNELAFELQGYKELVRSLDEVGVNVYLGNGGSMLGEFLMVRNDRLSLV